MKNKTQFLAKTFLPTGRQYRHPFVAFPKLPDATRDTANDRKNRERENKTCASKEKIPFSNETKRDFYFIKLVLRRYFQAFQ